MTDVICRTCNHEVIEHQRWGCWKDGCKCDLSDYEVLDAEIDALRAELAQIKADLENAKAENAFFRETLEEYACGKAWMGAALALGKYPKKDGDDDLPTLASLRGIAPNITGGKQSEDFIREIRDGDKQMKLFMLRQTLEKLEEAKEAALEARNSFPCGSLHRDEINELMEYIDRSIKNAKNVLCYEEHDALRAWTGGRMGW